MIRHAATIATGGMIAAGSFAAAHLPIFAQTVIGNLTPLMIMAVLGAFLRGIKGARVTYRELCEKVAHLEDVVKRIEEKIDGSNRGRKRRRG